MGTLRGFDAFLNVVLEEAIDEKHQSVGNNSNGGGSGEGNGGSSSNYLGQIVIRGNSIVQFETLERL